MCHKLGGKWRWSAASDANAGKKMQLQSLRLHYVMYMSRNSFLWHNYKMGNQALIWDLIKGTQCEEALLTKNEEYVNSENASLSI